MIKIWPFVPVFFLLAVLLFSKELVFHKNPIRKTSSNFQNSKDEQRLKNILTCALDKLKAPPQSRLTLNSIYRELSTKFKLYNVVEDLEKIHFLSQAMVETDDLLYTVEKTQRSKWKKILENANLSKWDCKEYLSAIDNDKDYFDDIRRHSSYPYKSAFRGRGLHHLTHCANYLGLFYHKTAQRIGDRRSRYMKTDFYDHNGDLIELDVFCDEDLLKHVSSKQFEEAGLPPLSENITNRFEKTINKLSLPCRGEEGLFIQGQYQCPKDQGLPCSNNTTFRFMSSLEFIVDSALWHWKRCQRISHNFLEMSSPHAVGMIAYCIHGAEKYKSYQESSCDTEKDGQYLESYWKRLERFRILQDCFAKFD